MRWILILVTCIEVSRLVNAQSKRLPTATAEDARTATNKPIPVELVQGVAGKHASLPCNIQQGESAEVSMVLWFKEDSGEPLYSYDARNQTLEAKLSSAPHVWDHRATFYPAIPGRLMIRDIRESDEGVYRCRVDFRNSPTRNFKVNFTVIVPPAKPIIYDDKRRVISDVLEAYSEGTNLTLVCEVHGGKPKPRVIWLLQSRQLNGTTEEKKIHTSNEESNIMTISTITLKSLTRSHHHTNLSCKASNTNLAPPPTTYVIIKLNLKPLFIKIYDKPRTLSSGTQYRIECRSTGSKPPAVITWWKSSKQLKEMIENSSNNTVSISILKWTPSPDDDRKFLICRAENPKLPETAIEDRWQLQVHYSPQVTLKLDSSLDPNYIKEGNDVYFECNVRANPRHNKLTWFHGTKELHHNVTAGIVLSDHSLVLQGVTRESAGEYTCQAANVEGQNKSNIVNLEVMFAPVCKRMHNASNWRHQHIKKSTNKIPDDLGTLKKEVISVVCEVEAIPTSVTFYWTFNSSGDLSDIPSKKYSSEGTISKLNYTPPADVDYGMLSCWAKNIVGQSKQPCLFQVISAGRPNPLQNCTAYNQTDSWIRISCIEGYDGGLPQKFIAVIDEKRFESSNPIWDLELHKPSTITLYAVNLKGSSDPFVMEEVTLKGVAKFTGESVSSIDMSPILIGLGSTATGLGLVVTGVLMALWRRYAATPAKPKQSQQPTIATFAGKAEEEDGNPDLIPTTILNKKFSGYGSLPRRIQQPHVHEITHGFLHDSNHPRGSPNMYYSLQRPNRCPETIVRANTIQESCI